MSVRFRNNKVLLLLFSGLLYLSGITLSPADDKERPVTESDEILQGIIKEVSPVDPITGTKGMHGSFLIHKNNGGQQRHVVIHVLATTRIFVGRGAGSVPGEFSTLHVGDKVKVTISGGRMMLSYPLQATAVEVLIIKSGKP